MTEVSRETTQAAAALCGRCLVRPASPGQRRCIECHADDMRARRAGMVNVLLTPDEWAAVKAARLAAANRGYEGLSTVHYRAPGQLLLACGAEHRGYRAADPVCCTSDPERVSCQACRATLSTGPSKSAISRPAAPAGAGDGIAADGTSSTTPSPSAPGTTSEAEPQIYLQIGGRRPGLYVDGEKVS